MKHKVLISFFLLVMVFGALATIDLCGDCKKEECMPPLSCKYGETKDICGCCNICIRSEGEMCGGVNSQLGKCKEGLICRTRRPNSSQNLFLPQGYKVGKCEPEACEKVKCGLHQLCTVQNGSTECVCPMKCGNKLQPVCGLSDGKDYKNPCKVREMECKLQTSISFLPGYCEGCTKNGKDYKFGQKSLGKKRCEECVCRHGKWVCSLNLRCLREVVYKGFQCTGYTNKHSSIDCPDGYKCNITTKGKDGYADKGVCVKLIPENICMMKADPGPCFGYFVRWFFNSTKQKCEKFVYGGCRGNDNRFKAKRGCDAVCKRGRIPKRIETEPFSHYSLQKIVNPVQKKVGRMVKVNGKMKLNKKPGQFPNGSCLSISVEDISMADAPSILMASQRKDISGVDIAKAPLHYTIHFLPKKGHFVYSVSAVINVGWCPSKGSKEWIRTNDYLTTVSYNVPMDIQGDIFSIDLELEFYGKRPEPPVTPEVPEEVDPFRGSGGRGHFKPIKYGKEIATIHGTIQFKKEILEFPPGSCMRLKVSDVSLLDVASITLASQNKDISGLKVKNNQLKYMITMKKPLPSEFYRSFSLDAVFNMGWCRANGSDEWLKEGDYLTDTAFSINFNKKNNSYLKDIHVIHYCLSKGCAPQPQPQPQRDEDKKESGCYCNKTQKYFPLGAEWETKDCQLCRCEKTGAVCKRTYCPVLSCKRTILVPGSCCPVCSTKGKFCHDHNGKRRNFDDTWRGRDDCERCQCGPDGRPMCVIAMCLDPICARGKPVKVPGMCCRVCPDQKICREEHTDEVYVEGRMWQLRNCSLRYCSANGILDVSQEDVVKKCPYPTMMERRCPALCPRKTVTNFEKKIKKEKKEKKDNTTGMCLDNRTKNKRTVGSLWYADPCKVCLCAKGYEIRCISLTCKKKGNCESMVNEDGKCCPVCKTSANKTCTYSGRKYSAGQHFVKEDKCTVCACENGALECSKELCSPPRKECVHEGKKYPVGAARNASDGCNTCVCHGNDMWGCTLMFCPITDELYPIIRTLPAYTGTIPAKTGTFPKTTPESKGCVHKGKKYAVGETRTAFDGCNHCFCAETGDWGCTLKLCVGPRKTEAPEPTSATVVLKTDAAKGCIHKGVKYSEGSSRSDDDGCNTCICSSGKWGCTKKLCVKQNSEEEFEP